MALIALHREAFTTSIPMVGYEKHLLIDGSNIMHAWAKLRILMKGDRDTARAKLSQLLSVIHDEEQVRLTLVFDGRGEELTVEYPGTQKTFAHIYTPAGTTADDVIEQLVGQSSEPGNCTVATDDRAERQTIEASGACGISAGELAAWVERAEVRQRSRVAGLKRDNERSWRRPENEP